MPGLTETEQAQIIDILGWSNQQYPEDYVTVRVIPTLQQLTNEASLAIVRGHLEKVNTIQEQLIAVVPNFSLDDVKGIKFSSNVERRLWGQFRAWMIKLAGALSLKYNPRIYKTNRGRSIV